MRALLVVNPRASTTTAAGRDVIAHALASQVKLDVAQTRHRGHAAELAAQAHADGIELVVVLVGHGHFSRVLAARWLGLPAVAGVGFALDAGAVSVLGDERGMPRLDHVNVPPLATRT